jgi:ABC-type molybdate transport system substrate-binding protein
VELAGRFPSELQYLVTLVGGVGTTANEAAPAKAFINYLLAPEAASVFKAKGLEPPAP